MERVQHLKILLKEIVAATNNFDEIQNCIGRGGFGRVYKGKLSLSAGFINVAVKRLDRQSGQGDDEFLTEIAMLSEYKHRNLASLVGYSDESDERILVYVHESRGSLDQYIRKTDLTTDLTWVQRLHISIGAARGLHYLHDEVGSTHRILHRDIKSANILLDENWEAKVSDFGLSRIAPANMAISFVSTAPCGTPCYVDPLYFESNVLTKESDIYSFGVVLFEILCGWLAFQPRHGLLLVPEAKLHYEQNTLDDIIDPDLRTQMELNSLNIFSAIAYKCLKPYRGERPTTGEIIEKLEKALEHQGRLNASGSGSLTGNIQQLKIPLKEIMLATDNFDKKNLIAKDGFGSVYKGKLSWSGCHIAVSVRRLDPKSDQEKHVFLREITILSSCKHKSLDSLVGFCDDGQEKVLVYVDECRGSLDSYISNTSLTWMQRLEISIGAARGLNYLHDEVGKQHRVLHGDIKSATILLNDNWESKISNFGISEIGPSNLQHPFRGTIGYNEPICNKSGVLTKESDVYSFGVVLFEILCGRMAFVEGYEDGYKYLAPLAAHKFEESKLDEIIDPNLRKQMKLKSLNTFSEIAYQCLKNNRSERPTMALIVEELEEAFEYQASLKTAEIARVGIWGTKSSGGPEHHWAFLLEKDHKLKILTIDHGDLIYSLMFTCESKGVLYPYNKVGGWNGGDTVSKVMFEDEEEIIGINGTVGVRGGYRIISSLSFITNKVTHGPFGHVTDSPFSVPWDKGNFGGFYGFASDYIDAIGVYMKASSEEITRIGIWGTKSVGGPETQWYLHVDRSHHLKKITIDHGDLIYSLIFTTEYRGKEHISYKSGGWNGGDIVSEVKFAQDEEINGMSGTVGVSGGYTIISSLSFITNKRTHGPYGRATGTPFAVSWDNGAFVGFYGIASYYLDGIGIYLKSYLTKE